MNFSGLELSEKPYYQDSHRLLFNKDSRFMSELPDESVQMVVTSPPYWGLRKYAGLPDLIWGGKEDCQHEWQSGRSSFKKSNQGVGSNFLPITDKLKELNAQVDPSSAFCSLCGACKGAYGLEPTPEMYVQHTVEILREIRRVLRKDGVVFWNIDDSYFGGGFGTSPGGTEDFAQRYPKQASNAGTAQHEDRLLLGKLKKSHPILKPKDLCLIPFRVAISAQEDGWWVRSVIIWNKPNPMPESVTDRPTESHEYILMLTKSAKYYWDQEAVRESVLQASLDRDKQGYHKAFKGRYQVDWEKRDGLDSDGSVQITNPAGRNLRSVWTFPTQPYKEAHFATYPEKLVEICVKAATPEVGCCSKCGKPWVRITESYYTKDTQKWWKDYFGEEQRIRVADISKLRRKWAKEKAGNYEQIVTAELRVNNPVSPKEEKLREILNRDGMGVATRQTETLGWKPQCKCNADKVPSIVLDPFAGSGTTLKVAAELNRRAIGYELSEEYCKLAVERNRQEILI